MGSGFLLADDLVMTAAHVVKGTRTVSVQTESGELAAATVIAYEDTADAALVRLAEPLEGQAASFDTDQLEQGSDLAVLGFPLRVYDLRMVTGIVSGVNESVDYGDLRVERVFTTDASTNGGNSGGPVFNRDREVIGLVSGGENWDSAGRPVQGINYIVPSAELAPRFEEWRSQDDEEAPACDDEGDAATQDDGVLDVVVDSADEEANAIAQTMFTHGRSINEASYASAWTVFTPRMQRRLGSLEAWSAGLDTSYWEDLRIFNVEQSTDGQITLDTELRTRQDAKFGFDGQTCSQFELSYTMIELRGVWRIDRAQRRGDPEPC